MSFPRSANYASPYNNICRFQKSSQHYGKFYRLFWREWCVYLTGISYPVIGDLKNTFIVCDLPKGYWRVLLFISMPDALIRPYHAIIWFMMSFINDPIHPVKTLWSLKNYVLFTTLITIFLDLRPYCYGWHVCDGIPCVPLVVLGDILIYQFPLLLGKVLLPQIFRRVKNLPRGELLVINPKKILFIYWTDLRQ